MSSAPLGTTEITITWESADIQAWATEYDQRYQEIGQAWMDLWGDVGAALADLAETYGPLAEDLIEREKDLNEEMWNRAVGYVGQAISFDGTPLAEICPFFAVELKGMKIHELFKRETIVSLAAKAGKAMNKPHVMTTVTFDLAAMGRWAETSIQRYADIDRAYHEALEAAFWDDVNAVQAFFQDIAQQISETTTLVATPAPKVMTHCSWYTSNDYSQEMCEASPENYWYYDYYYQMYVCDVYYCEQSPLEKIFDPIVEDIIEPAFDQIRDLGDDIFDGALIDALRWAGDGVKEFWEIQGDYERAVQDQFHQDVETATEWVEGEIQTAGQWAETAGRRYEDLTYARDQAFEDTAEAMGAEASEFWEQNSEQIQANLEWFFGDSVQIIEEMAQDVAEQAQSQIETWIGDHQQTLVKSAPTTESSYGLAIGAGVCVLAIGAFALYKKSRKTTTQANEALLQDEEEFTRV